MVVDLDDIDADADDNATEGPRGPLFDINDDDDDVW